MSIGVYGNIKPSDVKTDDISVYYNYVPNRETNNSVFNSIVASDILTQVSLPSTESIAGYNENILEGLYDLKLPATVFSTAGIYTLYIKPKVIPAVISDCSVLSALPSVRGIVIETKYFNENQIKSNALQGFRIEYVNADGTKLRNVSRFVVTSNKVVPVTENVGNTTQKANRYRYDDSGTLLFLQLTPSSSSDVKPNQQPFMGTVGQTILISNTYFTPLTIEIEMVENTLDTIAQILVGEQINNVKDGMITYYDKNRKITNQFDLYIIKDSLDTVPQYEVKEKRTNIDATQDFNSITTL